MALCGYRGCLKRAVGHAVKKFNCRPLGGGEITDRWSWNIKAACQQHIDEENARLLAFLRMPAKLTEGTNFDTMVESFRLAGWEVVGGPEDVRGGSVSLEYGRQAKQRLMEVTRALPGRVN